MTPPGFRKRKQSNDITKATISRESAYTAEGGKNSSSNALRNVVRAARTMSNIPACNKCVPLIPDQEDNASKQEPFARVSALEEPERSVCCRRIIYLPDLRFKDRYSVAYLCQPALVPFSLDLISLFGDSPFS